MSLKTDYCISGTSLFERLSADRMISPSYCKVVVCVNCFLALMIERGVVRKMNRPSRQAHATASTDESSSTTAMTPSIAAVPDQVVAETFHKELLETCIDMLLRYTYFNSSSLPKRSVDASSC